MDHLNRSLAVEEGLESSLHHAAKHEGYGRAIAAWNALDGSTRYRVPMPLRIAVSSASASEDSQGQGNADSQPEEEEAAPLHSKWAMDLTL